MSRRHGALQTALATVTYLNQLVGPCEAIGVNINHAVQFESANVLWDQGEMAASIRTLQDLNSSVNASHQVLRVGKPEILAKLVREYLCTSTKLSAHAVRVIKYRRRDLKSLTRLSIVISYLQSRNFTG